MYHRFLLFFKLPRCTISPLVPGTCNKNDSLMTFCIDKRTVKSFKEDKSDRPNINMNYMGCVKMKKTRSAEL